MTALAPIATRDWNGVIAMDPPDMRGRSGPLIAMVETMLASRQRNYPAMIEQGTLDPDDAAAEIAAIESILADCRFIWLGEGSPASMIDLPARQQALDRSLATLAGLADRFGHFTPERAHQAECVVALRWHFETDRWSASIARRLLTPSQPPENTHA
jgi:hypothetical protein